MNGDNGFGAAEAAAGAEASAAAEAAEAGAGFGAAEAAAGAEAAGLEGSQAWWSYEIASREASAIANTEFTPSQEAAYTTDFYQDPRTGEMYGSYSQFLSQNPMGVSIPPASNTIPVVTPDGNIFQTTYSQYWMDPNYTGPEPSVTEKAAYSTADYARDFAGTLAEMYATQDAQVSPVIKQIATTYPKIQVDLTEQPVTQTVAEQSTTTASANELTDKMTDILNQGIDWLTNNLLVVVIVVSAVIILPRILPAPSGRRH